MYSEEDLNSAVDAGVIDESSATAFRNYVADQRVTPDVDEEHFRLISGFNDIFVVIAILLLLSSLMWIGHSQSLQVGITLQVIASWGLAEFFTRKRRMALPSIVLLLTFVGGVLGFGITALADSGMSTELNIGIPSGLTAFAAWLHWQRFRVPITIAAGTAAVVSGCMMALFALIPATRDWLAVMIFVAGLLVFAIAMRWDISDIVRQTRRSDVAFWLHLIAAPLLVHPVFSALKVFDGDVSILQASAVGLLYVAVAIISISIDRRAMMVSALVYVLYAFNALLEQYGVVSLGFALIAFSIGSGLLLLSAFWQTCRKALLPLYPVNITRLLPALR